MSSSRTCRCIHSPCAEHGLPPRRSSRTTSEYNKVEERDLPIACCQCCQCCADNQGFLVLCFTCFRVKGGDAMPCRRVEWSRSRTSRSEGKREKREREREECWGSRCGVFGQSSSSQAGRVGIRHHITEDTLDRTASFISVMGQSMHFTYI